MKTTRREAAAAILGAPALLSQQRKPNLVLILSDDHSVPFLGCYDYPIKTPNLDRFASEGMRFNKAFTAAPQCVPSRTALLTGRSPVSARMGRFSSPLPPDVTTLPEMLREAGYFTGVCRRWMHLDGPGYGRLSPASKEIAERNNLLTWKNRVDFLDASGPADTEKVLNSFFDQRGANKPYFLWANFNDPHHVWDKNQYSDAYDPAKLKVPGFLPDLPGVREDLSRYCGEVTRMDGEFQLVIETIKRRGDIDNTLVVFMGDNGMAFPRGKGSLYDPGLNVPLLSRWPGRIQGGGVSNELISGEDMTPTFLEAAGLRPLRTMTGRSFLHTLQGDTAEHRKHIFGARLYHGNGPFTETTKANTWDQSRCARSKTHKLIYNCTPWMEYAPVDSMNDPGWKNIVAAHQSGALAKPFAEQIFGKRPIWQLFDLQRDPNEFENLAGRPEMAGVLNELKLAIQEKMMIDYDFLPTPLPVAG